MPCGLYPGTRDRPLSSLSEGCTEFEKKRWADSNVLLLTVCTGSLALTKTGVLDGKHVPPTKWQCGTEEGGRRREAQKGRALGGRCERGEWEGLECSGAYGGVDLAA